MISENQYSDIILNYVFNGNKEIKFPLYYFFRYQQNPDSLALIGKEFMSTFPWIITVYPFITELSQTAKNKFPKYFRGNQQISHGDWLLSIQILPTMTKLKKLKQFGEKINDIFFGGWGKIKTQEELNRLHHQYPFDGLFIHDLSEYIKKS